MVRIPVDDPSSTSAPPPRDIQIRHTPSRERCSTHGERKRLDGVCTTCEHERHQRLLKRLDEAADPGGA
jgi:hypothetical protein